MKGRRAALWSVVLLTAAVIAAVVALGGDDQQEGVARALDLLADDERFDDAAQSGDTFALVASVLLSEADDCRDEHGEVPMCEARLSAGSYAQVFAVGSLRCSRPMIFRGRVALRNYLQDVAQLSVDAAMVPVPPELPTC